MLDAIRNLFQRKQDEPAAKDTTAVPDLSGLAQAGVNARTAEVAVAPGAPESKPVEVIMSDPIIEESEEQWSARIHAEWFAKEAGLK